MLTWAIPDNGYIPVRRTQYDRLPQQQLVLGYC